MHKRFLATALAALLTCLVFIPGLADTEVFPIPIGENEYIYPAADSEYMREREALNERVRATQDNFQFIGIANDACRWINLYQYSASHDVSINESAEFPLGRPTGYNSATLYMFTYIPVDNETHAEYAQNIVAVYPEYSGEFASYDPGAEHVFCDDGNGNQVCYLCGYVKDSYYFPQYEQPFDPSTAISAELDDEETGVSAEAEAFAGAAQAYFNQYEGIKDPFKFGVRWCVEFVCKCADDANIPKSVLLRTNSSTQLFKFLLKHGGQIVTEPQAGDLIFYKSHSTAGAYAHTGIMISETESIQGNISNQVKYLSKPTRFYYSYPDIPATADDVVYVRPNYGY